MALGHRAAVELCAGPIPAGPVSSGAPRLELELRNDVAEHDRNIDVPRCLIHRDAGLGDFPLIRELDYLEDRGRLQACNPIHPAQPAGDEIQEVLLVEEERLDDDVVPAGGDSDVALPSAV